MKTSSHLVAARRIQAFYANCMQSDAREIGAAANCKPAHTVFRVQPCLDVQAHFDTECKSLGIRTHEEALADYYALKQFSVIDTCVVNWANAAQRPGQGSDAIVTMDEISEWKGWCQNGKSPARQSASGNEYWQVILSRHPAQSGDGAHVAEDDPK